MTTRENRERKRQKRGVMGGEVGSINGGKIGDCDGKKKMG
jgi:hypothetical protein